MDPNIGASALGSSFEGCRSLSADLREDVGKRTRKGKRKGEVK